MHIRIAAAADGVADLVTHDGNVRVEFLFPFLKDERAEKRGQRTQSATLSRKTRRQVCDETSW